MSYIKAEAILPKELLQLVQEYAQGQYLYNTDLLVLIQASPVTKVGINSRSVFIRLFMIGLTVYNPKSPIKLLQQYHPH